MTCHQPFAFSHINLSNNCFDTPMTSVPPPSLSQFELSSLETRTIEAIQHSRGCKEDGLNPFPASVYQNIETFFDEEGLNLICPGEISQAKSSQKYIKLPKLNFEDNDENQCLLSSKLPSLLAHRRQKVLSRDLRERL